MEYSMNIIRVSERTYDHHDDGTERAALSKSSSKLTTNYDSSLFTETLGQCADWSRPDDVGH